MLFDTNVRQSAAMTTSTQFCGRMGGYVVMVAIGTVVVVRQKPHVYGQ